MRLRLPRITLFSVGMFVLFIIIVLVGTLTFIGAVVVVRGIGQ